MSWSLLGCRAVNEYNGPAAQQGPGGPDKQSCNEINKGTEVKSSLKCHEKCENEMNRSTQSVTHMKLTWVRYSVSLKGMQTMCPITIK